MRRYECRIAGVRVLSNRPADSQHPHLDGPAWCEVRFTEAPEAAASEWLSIPNPGTGAGVAIRPDGRAAVIVAAGATESACARELRWAVPFIAALQGETILHASAVERGGRLYAFIAESRTGKSTFSAVLARRGWNKAADDLLPECLGRPAALFFLQRPPQCARAALRRLDREEALAELVTNGFGELAAPALWKTHFRYYCALVESVPCYECTIPDGLERVEEAAEWWERAIEAEDPR